MNGRIKLVSAMLIYGSIGVFVKNINLPALQIAFMRALIGTIFLIVTGFFTGHFKLTQTMKGHNRIYLLSGILLAINWVLLFKAFEYTTISRAILIYYFAPIIVIALSPIVLKEKITPQKIACMLVALVGLVLVVFNKSMTRLMDSDGLLGMGFAFSAAIFYACVILINKRYPVKNDLEITMVQLLASTLVLIPALFISSHTIDLHMIGSNIGIILVLGILHTGIAYLLYFSSMKSLNGQTVAIYCYIDPISAMFFAYTFLGEHLSIMQVFGGGLILLASYFIDFDGRKEKRLHLSENNKALE